MNKFTSFDRIESPTFPKPKGLNYKRLLKRNGHFNLHKHGISRVSIWIADFYHFLCNLNWGSVLLITILYYILVNALFGTLYYFDFRNLGNINDMETWFDAFCFSVQTYGTIGYGYLYPKGVYINIIVGVQVWFSLISNAIVVAIIITKIQRPARLRFTVEFSKEAVLNNSIPSFSLIDNAGYYPIGEYQQGANVFAFRILNLRKRLLCMPDLSLLLLHKKNNKYIFTEMDYEINEQIGRPRGDSMSKPHLQLPWTITHKIDKYSPLFGKTRQEMIDDEFEIICILDSVDELTGLSFQCRRSYLPNEIRLHHDFVDMVSRDANGLLVVDYTKLSDTIICPIVGDDEPLED